MTAQTYYMYVVRCADNTLYTGFTTNVEARICAHNSKRGAKYTKQRTPVVLEAYAQFSTKREALRAEYYFKQLSRAEKEEILIYAHNEDTFTEKIREILSHA
ncbi:MAG: GIY-YIG nuclease family protein [Eggerthellaceae bacterium]|nr:GIY-YIG nuclease family protein [Eggerthellaceae bacterium]